jgi:hypothetical protein
VQKKYFQAAYKSLMSCKNALEASRTKLRSASNALAARHTKLWRASNALISRRNVFMATSEGFYSSVSESTVPSLLLLLRLTTLGNEDSAIYLPEDFLASK